MMKQILKKVPKVQGKSWESIKELMDGTGEAWSGNERFWMSRYLTEFGFGTKLRGED